MRSCPRCEYEGISEAECARCGVVYEKVGRREAAAARNGTPRALVVDESELPESGRLDARTLNIVGGGALAAVVVYLFPLTRFVLSALVTLFHELGHAVAGWLMGHPSLPAFDFVYGGGMTSYGAFQRALVVMVGLAFVVAGWLLRGRSNVLAIVITFAAIWLLFVSAEWRREVLMAAAGHLAELILAGVFFYRALSGHGLRHPAIERPLASFAAFFVAMHSILFANRLRSDAEFLSWYREGKGGMLNDLESVALDLVIHLGWAATIEAVAAWLLAFSLVPFAIALFWHLERARVHRWLRSHRRA